MTSKISGYLIDTSVLIPYIKQNRAIVPRVDNLSGRFICAIIVAELAYGAHRSNNPIDGVARVNGVVVKMPSAPMDEDVGFMFARSKNFLARANQLIPDNDIWIAATAMVYGLTLITRDAHFQRLIRRRVALL